MKRLGWAALAVALVTVSGCTGSDTSGTRSSKPSRDSPSTEQARHYRLTMRETLSHGLYKRAHEAAGPDRTLAEAMAGQVDGATAAFGAYDPVVGHGVLTVTGVYGTSVPSPVRARDELIELLDHRDGGPRVVVGPRTITPSGTDESLECRVAKVTRPDIDVVGIEPSCVWGDASTVVKVAIGMDPRRVSPSDIDLQHFASEVAGIRDEVRKAN